jgi:hypothetical protein
MVGRRRIELRTLSLKARCSTTELTALTEGGITSIFTVCQAGIELRTLSMFCVVRRWCNSEMLSHGANGPYRGRNYEYFYSLSSRD